MQQRVQMEQAMEQEKDRAQQIKVQEMQFKNQQAMEKMRQQQEEARLKQQGMTRKPITLPGGGLAEYVPGADGQPGTVNTILQPTVKPIAKSYTTMYGNDGTAYGVNRADPNEVLVIKDPVTGEPIKRAAGQTGKRLVNDASGMPYMLDMATGAIDPVDVPEGFAEKSPSGMTPTQTLDLELKAIRLVKEQNREWFDNDRYSTTFGELKPEFAGQFEAEVSRRVQAAIQPGTPPPSGAPASQGGGMPGNPPMARRGFVNGKPALIDDATGEYVLMDEEPIAATNPPAVDVAVPPTVPQQAPAPLPQQPLFDPFANPGILFRTPQVPAGSVTIPYQNPQRSYGTIYSR
jgi:hypothetical protein